MNLEGNFEKDIERLGDETKDFDEHLIGEKKDNIVEWHEISPEEELRNILNTYQKLAELQKLGENVAAAIAVNDNSFKNNLAKLEARPGVSKELVDEYRRIRNSIINPSTHSNHIRTL